MSFGREISLPVIREDLLSDPFSPPTDEVISLSSAGIAISFPFDLYIRWQTLTGIKVQKNKHECWKLEGWTLPEV